MNTNATLGPRSDFAQVLHGARSAIMDRWTSRARADVDAARKVSELALKDELDHLLEALEHAFSVNYDEQAHAEEKDKIVARHHGEQRHSLQAYDLIEVLHEYRLLRTVVFETLFARANVLPQHAVQTVNDFFDIAISQAGQTFAQMRLEARTAELKHQRDAAASRAASVEKDNNDTTAKLKRSQGTVARLGETLEAKEQFVSFLSHDLRVPLSVITLNAEALLRRLEGTDATRQLERIKRASSQADSMVYEFLEARRVDALQPLLLAFEPCDLAHIVRHVQHEANQRHGERFELAGPSTLPGFWDSKAIGRALDNLCNNAIKYGDKHAPVRLVLAVHDAGVDLSVSNTGTPISGSDQKRLFKPFYQAAGREGRDGEGWGLGLAYVWQVAHLHGGAVSVTSNAADGTRFTLRLPLDARGAADPLS